MVQRRGRDIGIGLRVDGTSPPVVSVGIAVGGRRERSQYGIAPVQPVISSVFFKSGLMEAWGRGIPDIFNECKAAGLPTPEFESNPNFVCLTIRFKNPLRPYLSGESNGALNGELNGELNEALKSLRPAVRTTYYIIKKISIFHF